MRLAFSNLALSPYFLIDDIQKVICCASLRDGMMIVGGQCALEIKFLILMASKRG